MRGILINALKEALAEHGINDAQIHLEHPASPAFGDWASSVALQYSDKLGKTPRDLAELIAEHLRGNRIEHVEYIEVAGPGFINIHLSGEYFGAKIKEIVKRADKYGASQVMAEKKVMVEYTDPNPFKAFHIGHLMTNIIGESIARLHEFSGAEVRRVNYQGDVGLHVAKAVWGILNDKARMPEDGAKLADKSAFLGTAYTLGAKAYEENEESKREIDAINEKIYARSNEEINSIYERGRGWSLEHFEDLYEMLGTRFDYYFFESEVAKLALDIVEEYKAKGVFEISEGATVYRGEKYGLHTRVFLNAKGIPTYEAKELALAKSKHDTYPCDISIVVTANEISEYFKVLLSAMSIIFPDLARKTKHIGHGMMRFADGKMSSRKGNIVTGEALINDSIKLALGNINEHSTARDTSDPSWVTTDSKRADIATVVGIGALKYSILKQNLGHDMVYDPKTSFSFEGDSGPYLQYAYVRASSVLSKAEEVGVDLNSSLRFDSKPIILERLLARFPEVVERSGIEYKPHHIVTYLSELASEFNSYYARQKILDAEDGFSAYRVVLTKACSIVLKNGMALLGMSVPDRM